MVGEGYKTTVARRWGTKKMKRTDLKKYRRKRMEKGNQCECGVEGKLGSDTEESLMHCPPPDREVRQGDWSDKDMG